MVDLRLRLRETGDQIPDLVTVDARPSRGDVAYLKGAFADCRVIMLDELQSRLPIGCYGAYATIDCLQFEKGWFFTACRTCQKGVKAADENGSGSAPNSDLVCDCENRRPILVPKFRLDVSVIDDSGSASLTLFDQDIERLVEVTCAEVRKRVVSESVFPEELNKLIGMRLLFKVEVAAFNIEKNHFVFTCKDVTNKTEVIQPFLEKNNIIMELLEPVEKNVPLIDLESTSGSSKKVESPIRKRKVESDVLDPVSTISPTKINKQFGDVHIKKE